MCSRSFPINQGLMDNNRSFGEIRGEKLELLIDGERVHLYDWDKDVSTGAPVHQGTAEVHVQVKAGPHTVGVTFLGTQLAPGSDLNEHFLRSTIETGGLPGFKFWPHVGKVDILGPNKPAGAGESESREKIFPCKPAADQEAACARQIVSTLARHAFRRPVTAQDTEMLMGFYQQGKNEDGKFDTGIERALERVLADPEFVFRKESEPANLKAGQSYRVSDLELASRLSFFLWSSIPDDELINLASQNKLREPAILEQQVRRMLADARSERLVVNFAGQWLNLRSLQSWFPIPGLFPDWDDNLRNAMRTETELFVGSVIHEDRSVVDFINANYTFLNERLATALRNSECLREPIPQSGVTAGIRDAPGSSRAGEHRNHLGVSQPDVAHGAGQDDDADFPGRESARSAAERAGAEGRRLRRAFHDQADHARADGVPSQERALRDVSQDHGPHWILARELRCDRQVAGHRRWQPDQSRGLAGGWQ